MRKLFEDIGRYLLMLKGMFSKPENVKLYWKEFIHQCAEIGTGGLGIVAIISVFIGAVSAVQTAYQLVSPLIPKTTIAQIVRDTVVLEFAPTLVSIVLAGVIGSKIASELGNMRVSEQIDALEIMGINTKTYLILPKVLAALIIFPMFTVIAITLGIFGGRLAGVGSGIVSAETFDRGLLQSFVPFNVIFALIKSYLFAFIISSVAAYFGYNVKGGSLEIGKSSTKSVVVSCILILLGDYVLSTILL